MGHCAVVQESHDEAGLGQNGDWDAGRGELGALFLNSRGEEGRLGH